MNGIQPLQSGKLYLHCDEGKFTFETTAELDEVGDAANQRNIALLRAPNGFSFAPAKEGEVISPEDFAKLPAEEQQRIEHDTEMLQEMLEKVIHQVPRWRRERLERVRKLNEEAVLFAVGHMIDAGFASLLNEVDCPVILVG